MYYYIVDPQKISQNDFERVQNQLYSSTSQYRVSGEVVRATGLRTVSQLVENAFAHDAKTIVAVGSDETLHDVINAVGSRDMVIGFVPLFDSEIGTALGLIEKRGAFFRYNDGLLGQGREVAKEFLKANPTVALEIETAIRAQYGLIPEGAAPK